MNFKQLSLNPKLIQSLEDAGYEKPTAIQAQAIPAILEGQDIRGSAQTGTGKTAAFLLPLLHRLADAEPKKGKGPRALILAPTRELADQIAEQTHKYCKYLKSIKSVCVYGGVPYRMQERKLFKPYDLLIATPGRLVDFMKQNKIQFPRLEVLVFDEADHMLDMGFKDAVDLIVASVPKERQTILFSATLNQATQKLSERILREPVDIAIEPTQEKHEGIEQSLHYVKNLQQKNHLLFKILTQAREGSSIVFTATKRHANLLVEQLKEKGHKALGLHGDMSQAHRTRNVKKLRMGKVNILVATDVASRGLDVKQITHVINFDLPQKAEDYVHRIGRTGRAGAKGFAFSFAAKRDKRMVQQIEKFTGQPIAVC